MKLITVATVPHTATRSIVTLIDKHGYKKLQGILSKSKEIRKNKERNNYFTAHTETHNHIYLQELDIEYNKTKDILDCSQIDKNKINIIHGHIDDGTINCIHALNEVGKIIVSCRDPLLTLLTTKVRNDKKPMPSENHFTKYKDLPTRLAAQLISWELWANICKLDPFIVPVDITTDLRFGDIDFSKIGVVGSYGQYPLKKAYYDKDLEYIKKELEESYNYLTNLEPILRPNLEKIGYSELMWYSDY